MRKRFNINIWFLTVTVWLLVSGTAMSYANVYQPAAWNGQAVQPSYEFRSTSAYRSVGIGSTYAPQVSAPFASAPNNSPRRNSPWDEDPDDDDNPIGVVDDPAPVGDVAWIAIALWAAAYALYIRRKKTV